MKPRIVVCAAIRHRSRPNLIVCGPRHGDCLNIAAFVLNLPADGETWECGFVDVKNVFMTRQEAWKVADAAGQIRCPTGFERNYDDHRKAGIGDESQLFSENLY